MTLAAATITANHDSERWLRARVELVVASLPLTVVINPVCVVLLMIPLGGQFPAFGVIPAPILIAIVALHVFNAALAKLIETWAKRPSASPRQVFHWLLALQIWVGASWGLGALLCWVDGNAVNNTFIALSVTTVMLALALTRSVHQALFAAGIIPMTAMFWLRAASGAGEAADVFTLFTPVFLAYAWFMALSARDRVNQVLRTRFELEDMAVALRAAKAEAQAKTAEAEAASASKSAFVANMSHELRTPLNAILGFAEIIENEAVGPEVSKQYRSYAGDIRESGAHLLSLINDMLDVAKIEAGKMELDCQPLDARHAVDSAIRLVARRAEAKCQTIAVTVAPDVSLFADERAFKQVLLNLLTNAVKFSPEDGAIAVRCETMRDGSVVLRVEDSGPGIPADKIKQLFRPFSRVDNRYDSNNGGTGLGLALVRGLMTLHGGRVWVENKPDGGLLAAVVFPAVQREARVA